MNDNDTGGGRFTADPETIRRWAEEHDLVPVRVAGTETTDEGWIPYRLEPESAQTDTMEALSWDEFFEQIEAHELVVIAHGEGADRTFEVIDLDRAVGRTSLEPTELEERLLAGETITSEITETTVIERTIVEHATIESDVVETEVLDSRVVDVELLRREIGGCDVVDRDVLDDVDPSRFDDMSRLESGGLQEELPRSIAVEVNVEENWLVTRELLERATIESTIVDTDVTETDEVESETLESTIEIEGIQQTLLESDIVETEADVEEVIGSDVIASEFHTDDVVRTQLTQRQVVEDEITERKILRGELTESEVVQADTSASNRIETAFVDSEDLDAEVTPVGVTEYGTTAERDEGLGMDESVRMVPSEDDVGKRVVDARGETVGLVEEVRAGTAYVDPEPGLVDRIKAALEWGGADEDAYPLDEDQIERITDDEIELSVPK